MALKRLLPAIAISAVTLSILRGLSDSIYPIYRAEDAVSSVSSSNRLVEGPRLAHSANLTILAGELPGYTGWARPADTLAGQFDIVGYSSPTAEAGTEWTVTVACRHALCQSGGALFYVRAYGRAMLPGRVVDHKDGTYDVTILPFDAGQYQVEVVLTFSNPPKWEETPLTSKDGHPGYEGYLLPGFPLEVTVRPSPERDYSLLPTRRCSAKELMETGPDSALATGRWLVTDKVVARPWQRNATLHVNEQEQISEEGYQNSINSLGITMDYFLNDCAIMPMEEVSNPDTWTKALQESELADDKPLHVIFIGDSNTRNQCRTFRENVVDKFQTNGQKVQKTYIDVMGEFTDRLPTIRAQLAELAQKPAHYVIVFNIGLHEISKSCVPVNRQPCVPIYQNSTRILLNEVQKFPAMLRIWQSTTAGWPKWGVYGVAWPIEQAQTFPRVPDMCAHLNEQAWDIVSSKNIPVMDAYWLTVSRADHREVVASEKIKTIYKLVHLGPEVYNVLVRKLSQIILEAIRNGREGEVYL